MTKKAKNREYNLKIGLQDLEYLENIFFSADLKWYDENIADFYKDECQDFWNEVSARISGIDFGLELPEILKKRIDDLE